MRHERGRRGYVVEVNEVGIFATGIGVGWWTENILRRPIANRITWLALTPCGGVAQIPCGDREEAEFLHGYMLGHGIHRKHARSGTFAAEPPCPGRGSGKEVPAGPWALRTRPGQEEEPCTRTRASR